MRLIAAPICAWLILEGRDPLAVVVFVFAIGGRVFAADLGAGFVDAAHVVVLQVFADGMHQQIPIVVFLEDAGPFVEQVPADVLEILKILGRLDRHGKIAAALGRAILAEHFALGQIFAIYLGKTKSSGHGSLFRGERGFRVRGSGF